MTSRGGGQSTFTFALPAVSAPAHVNCGLPGCSEEKVHHRGTVRRSRDQSRAMALPAMLEHGRDARGTKSSVHPASRRSCLPCTLGLAPTRNEKPRTYRTGPRYTCYLSFQEYRLRV